jgi:hypothetical protein
MLASWAATDATDAAAVMRADRDPASTERSGA